MPLVGPFIRIFYGPEYAAATGLLQLLLVVVIIDAFATPVTLLVFPLERPKLYAASTALQVIILLLLAAWLIPSMGTSGAAVAKIVARTTGFVLVLWRLRLWRLPGRISSS
jgi:O-antigen/teichoic acid export membrane protein